MTTFPTPAMIAAIKEATVELDAAQAELLTVLSEVEHKDRADKTMITTLVRDALSRVGKAQRKLHALRLTDD